jgi:hypothetical protein
MKWFILCSLSMLFILSCGGKPNPRETPQQQDNSQEINNQSGFSPEKEIICQCEDTLALTDTIRSKTFANASKVELLKFILPEEELTETQEYRDLIKGGKFIRKNIEKRKFISDSAINKLEKILFNKKRVCSDGDYHTTADCLYQPHHAIVLYDNQKRAYAFLEICFICDAYRQSRGYSFGPMCDAVYQNLRTFFQDQGISPH